MTKTHARPSASHLATRVEAAAAALQLTDIAPDDPRLAADILPALRELRPRLTAESLTGIYAEGHPPGAAVHRRLLRRRLPGRWRAGGSWRRPYAAAVKLARKKEQVKGRVVAHIGDLAVAYVDAVVLGPQGRPDQ